ncbi:hypothetical protein MesoLj131b_59530 [Mesorhizobium sp. 131-2-5]|nr:hypothetical protein MesoLj131b_59530 [Mesorhizobium sp. 131-2-5]
MRLDMVEFHTLCLEEAGKRSHLVNDGVPDLVAGHPHLPPAETLNVRQAWMGADLYAIRLGAADGGVHVIRIGSVKTTGDIGDVDDRHHAHIIANLVKAKAFAHVAV